MGGVRRAVVKIYHGRNTDHLDGVWRTPQGEVDKERPEGSYEAAAVTGSLCGFERPLSEHRTATITA
jgi:hypothetical protein